jgi:hypothetical protein
VTEKTGGNSGQFKKGADSRRGVGKPGRSGRPPSIIRQRLRGSFEERIKVLEAIADDKKSSAAERLKALDLMAKYGLGTTSTSTDTDGNDVQRPGRLTPDEIEAELKRLASGD